MRSVTPAVPGKDCSIWAFPLGAIRQASPRLVIISLNLVMVKICQHRDETATGIRLIHDEDRPDRGLPGLTHFEEELVALLPRLRRFARSLSHNAVDADDLCQVAVEKALNNRRQWLPGTRMDSWMYRIMRNAWIDTARARTRASQTFVGEAAGIDVGDRGDKVIEARVELSNVESAMRRLPDEQREAIALVLIEGLAYQDAAAILDIPMGTLTSRLVRGRQALLTQLGESA
jgi:RNA polymerase sigma factor (sigma-70 family)